MTQYIEISQQNALRILALTTNDDLAKRVLLAQLKETSTEVRDQLDLAFSGALPDALRAKLERQCHLPTIANAIYISALPNGAYEALDGLKEAAIIRSKMNLKKDDPHAKALLRAAHRKALKNPIWTKKIMAAINSDDCYISRFTMSYLWLEQKFSSELSNNHQE